MTTDNYPPSNLVACGGKLFAAALRRTVGICRTRYVARARGAGPSSILVGRVVGDNWRALSKPGVGSGNEKSDAGAGEDVAQVVCVSLQPLNHGQGGKNCEK